MPQDIEDEFLGFDYLGSPPVTRLPPSGRIELGISRVSDDHLCLVTLHCAPQDTPYPPGMIRGRDNHDRSEMLPVEPWGKHHPFVFRSRDGPRNDLYVFDAE